MTRYTNYNREIYKYKYYILNFYLVEKKSMRFIGIKYNVSHHVISRRLSYWGYSNKKRDNGEASAIVRHNPNMPTRKTLEYKNWRLKILKRDNYTCQITNKQGIKLEIHHFKSFTKYPELRFEDDNAITMSKDLHREFHHTYGSIYFDENDFNNFKNKITEVI